MSQKYQIQQLQTYDSKPLQYEYGKLNNSNSMDSSANNNQVLQEMMGEQISLNKKQRKYGNIRIIYQNDKFLFTIGPDYVCFIIAYIMFTLLGFTIIYTAAVNIQNIWLNVINISISLIQNFSYLIIALSNPGIQTTDTLPTQEQQHPDQVKRFCKKCSIRMQKGTHHCRDCDVCVRQYDHHCPWTSKCIGQKNLSKFYFFVTSTMLYLVYCMIMLLVITAQVSLQNSQNMKNKITSL